MRRRLAIVETPRAGPTEISSDILEHGIMDGSRCSFEDYQLISMVYQSINIVVYYR